MSERQRNIGTPGKSSRAHGKRHGVGKKKSEAARRRHRHAKATQALARAARLLNNAAMRLYFTGQASDLDEARARAKEKS